MGILLFGPMTPPFNGQAVAFTTIHNHICSKDRLVINTAKFNSNLLNSCWSVLMTIYFFSFFKFSTIYFTSSRSRLGCLKDIPLLLLGRLMNKRIINHLHGADFKNFYDRSKFLKPVLKYCYGGVETSVVLIDQMFSEFRDFPNMKIRTVGNCFSSDLDSISEDFGKIQQIVFLSNLMKTKGIIEFLNASKILLKRYPNLKVKVAGNILGDNEYSEREIAKEVGKELTRLKNCFGERIEYLGVVNGEKKKKLLLQSSIFVLPSYYPTEAYPISIIEAMRTRNAIVTTNHNYLPAIVKPENGVLVDIRSVSSLVTGIETILTNSEKLDRIQKHNEIEAKNKYSENRYVQELKHIIYNQ